MRCVETAQQSTNIVVLTALVFVTAGYYLATLEAAAQHICDLADQYEKVARIDALFDDGEDIFEEHSTGAGSGAGQR